MINHKFIYSDSCQEYRYFPSQMFEAFPTRILTFSEKTFRCSILSQAITLETICGSGFFPLACPANAPLLDCRSWLVNLPSVAIYSDPRPRFLRSQGFQTPIKYFSRFTQSGRLLLKLHPCGSSFETYWKFLYNYQIFKLQLQKLHWLLGFIEISPFRELFRTYLYKSSKVLTADDDMKS